MHYNACVNSFFIFLQSKKKLKIFLNHWNSTTSAVRIKAHSVICLIFSNSKFSFCQIDVFNLSSMAYIHNLTLIEVIDHKFICVPKNITISHNCLAGIIQLGSVMLSAIYSIIGRFTLQRCSLFGSPTARPISIHNVTADAAIIAGFSRSKFLVKVW